MSLCCTPREDGETLKVISTPPAVLRSAGGLEPWCPTHRGRHRGPLRPIQTAAASQEAKRTTGVPLVATSESLLSSRCVCVRARLWPRLPAIATISEAES